MLAPFYGSRCPYVVQFYRDDVSKISLSQQYKKLIYLLVANACCVVVDISAKQAEIHEITPQSDIVWVNSDGYCYWDPRYELSAVHCSVDVTWFPFDVQRCSLVFESWLLTVDKLSITLYDDADALDNYVPSDEWNLTCACS